MVGNLADGSDDGFAEGSWLWRSKVSIHELLNTPSFVHAVCQYEDPEYFFPVFEAHLQERIEELRKMCGSCIHQIDCRTFAIENGEEHGFWGGTTPEERRSEIKTYQEGEVNRFEEIQRYLDLGWTKTQIAKLYGIQLDSVERVLLRAKKRGQI
jgi:WhiB family redox-sensing transcriptional regulator